MKEDTDSFPCDSLPRLLPRTQVLLDRLRELSDQELKALWKCNDKIAALNIQRLAQMDLHRQLTPAVMAYEGIQYQYMAPGVFSQEELDYVAEHLRILSGFYGLLRPFDGVRPYRLEMQAKLSADGAKDLYAFGGHLGQVPGRGDLCDCQFGLQGVQPLSSRHLSPGTRFLTCVFAEEKKGKLVEKGTMCKMARGNGALPGPKTRWRTPRA